MSNKKLTIVAKILAKPDQVSLVQDELQKLIAPTRVEEGCITYDLHQDNENPALFLFYETWATRDLWQKHMNNTHLAAFIAATEGALEELVVNEMTRIG